MYCCAVTFVHIPLFVVLTICNKKLFDVILGKIFTRSLRLYSREYEDFLQINLEYTMGIH